MQLFWMNCHNVKRINKTENKRGKKNISLSFPLGIKAKTNSHSFSLPQTHKHTVQWSLSACFTHAHTHTRTHTHKHAQMHTHTHTHTRMHTRIHTRTHTSLHT